MKSLELEYKAAKKLYDGGSVATHLLVQVVTNALSLLKKKATLVHLGMCDEKSYSVFRAGKEISRPFRTELFSVTPKEFQRDWTKLIETAIPNQRRFRSPSTETNRVLYTAVASFALCYDLWKPKSRKTPGTFFEIVVGSLLQLVLPSLRRTHHVILPGQDENVSTDIVFHRPQPDVGGLVIPVKITTRERVVQPFAHQRILDSVFGEHVFRSILVCMSEMQRDGDSGANAICVPGAIRLYQSHLSNLTGLYYLDPPLRYLQADVADTVHVRTLGDLLSEDLPMITSFGSK